MKVRIGNDICLHVSLLGENVNDYINIASIRAYLVNVTRQQELDYEHRRDTIQYRNEIEDRSGVVRYISRFPAEPRYPGYHGTPYDICHSGHPTYHVHPVHCVAPYIGFGVHPHTFDPFHNHLYAFDDMSDAAERMLHKDRDYLERYDQCEFLAPVRSTDQKNKVIVDFPACNQLFPGTYKLVIIAKLNQPGYAPNGTRTVTMDYNEVFTLVRSSEEGLDGNVSITIGNTTKVQYVHLTGDTAITKGGSGQLNAVVYPAELDDRIVVWSVIDPGNKVTITSSTDNNAIFHCPADFDGDEYTGAKIRATSHKDQTKYAEVPIIVTKQNLADKHLSSVEFNASSNGDKLVFNIAGVDTPVTLDTTNFTSWYEENE